jgi:hypothetical protein
MIFGWVTKRNYLEYHDPDRWTSPGSAPRPSGPNAA